jgi:hypothetical protein
MLIFILTLWIFTYILYFSGKKNLFRLDYQKMKILKVFHFGLLGILLLLGFLANQDTYVRGFYTTKILIWIFIFSAVILFVFGESSLQKRIERIYYSLYFYFPIAMIPLWFIPFLGWGINLWVVANTISFYSDIKYLDEKYRIQHIPRGFMAPASPPDLFVKTGILEYLEKPLEMHYLPDCDSIKIKEIKQSGILISFYHHGSPSIENPFNLNVRLEK